MTKEYTTFENFISVFLKKDYETIKSVLLTNNFDINREDFRGATALHYAAEMGDVEMIKIILNQPKARINVKTLDMGSTPLMIAAGSDKIEAVNYLIERGADVGITNNNGFTALMIAAEVGSVDCVQALLNSENCNINAQNHYGSNALMQGIKYIDVVKILINFIDLSQEDDNQANVLHYACSAGSSDVVRLLLDNGSFDIDKPNKFGETAIHLAIKQKQFDLVQYLIEKGASMTKVTLQGLNGYHLIIMNDDTETFFDCFECPDDYLDSMIEKAAEFNRKGILEKLIKRYCELSSFNTDELVLRLGNALIAAAQCGNLDCVKLLMVNISIGEESLTESLVSSLNGNHYNCFEYIYNSVSKIIKFDIDSLFAVAVDSGCVEACKMLLENGVEPNGPNPETYLMAASAHGHLEIAELLIENGSDINRVHEEMGTALLLAAINNHLDIVKYLLDRGADPTLSDESGFNPLIVSAFYGYSEIFDVIFAIDKNIQQKTLTGMTLFLASCSSGNVDIVKKLIKYGANTCEVDENNDNCLHLAAEKVECLQVLLYLLENIENLEELLTTKNNKRKTALDLIISHSNQSYLFSILAAKTDFQKYLIGPHNFLIESNENNDMCLICRDEFLQDEQATYLPCKHLFHENCYTEWSLTKANCPYCQRFPFKLK